MVYCLFKTKYVHSFSTGLFRGLLPFHATAFLRISPFSSWNPLICWRSQLLVLPFLWKKPDRSRSYSFSLLPQSGSLGRALHLLAPLAALCSSRTLHLSCVTSPDMAVVRGSIRPVRGTRRSGWRTVASAKLFLPLATLGSPLFSALQTPLLWLNWSRATMAPLLPIHSEMKRQAIVLSIIELLSKQTHTEMGNSVKAACLSCNSGGRLGLET